MTAAIPQIDPAPRFLGLWADLYWTYVRPLTPKAETWNSATVLIDAALATERSARERLRNVLDDSDRLFSPLCDPLKIDFGTHRWLSSSREEAYSDWLAWTLEQTSNPRQILSLFGIQHDFLPDEPIEKPAVEREVSIFDPIGRLDLIVRFGNHSQLLVEIKTKAFDAEAVQKQLIDYAKWASNWPVQTICIFLAIDINGFECPPAFETLSWRELSLRIRGLARQWISTSGRGLQSGASVIRAAMALGFCGAIERNLLALSGEPERFGVLASAEYLQQWLAQSER